MVRGGDVPNGTKIQRYHDQPTQQTKDFGHGRGSLCGDWSNFQSIGVFGGG